MEGGRYRGIGGGSISGSQSTMTIVRVLEGETKLNLVPTIQNNFVHCRIVERRVHKSSNHGKVG